MSFEPEDTIKERSCAFLEEGLTPKMSVRVAVHGPGCLGTVRRRGLPRGLQVGQILLRKILRVAPKRGVVPHRILPGRRAVRSHLPRRVVVRHLRQEQVPFEPRVRGVPLRTLPRTGPVERERRRPLRRAVAVARRRLVAEVRR